MKLGFLNGLLPTQRKAKAKATRRGLSRAMMNLTLATAALSATAATSQGKVDAKPNIPVAGAKADTIILQGGGPIQPRHQISSLSKARPISTNTLVAMSSPRSSNTRWINHNENINPVERFFSGLTRWLSSPHKKVK